MMTEFEFGNISRQKAQNIIDYCSSSQNIKLGSIIFQFNIKDECNISVKAWSDQQSRVDMRRFLEAFFPTHFLLIKDQVK